MKKFRPEMEGWYKTDAIYDYNYLNNAQRPSGEIAFKNMCILLGQVKRPMIHRYLNFYRDNGAIPPVLVLKTIIKTYKNFI